MPTQRVLTRNASKAIRIATDIAQSAGRVRITPVDMLMALLHFESSIPGAVLSQYELSYNTSQPVASGWSSAPEPAASFAYDDIKSRFFDDGFVSRVFLEASRLGHVYPGLEHLLLAVVSPVDANAEVLKLLEVAGTNGTAIRTDIERCLGVKPS